VVYTEVTGNAGCAGDQAESAECFGCILLKAAGLTKAILQACVIVVDGAQVVDGGLECVVELDEETKCGCGEIDGHASGDYVVEEITRSEGDAVGTEQILFKAGEMGEPEGEAGVVAKRAQVADVIGETLMFEDEGAQSDGARGTGGVGDGFKGRAIGPGKCDR